MIEKKIAVRGMIVNRIDFTDQEELIGYFLDQMLCRPGIASKVVGNTLLWWEKGQGWH
jgi:hypothetical protein